MSFASARFTTIEEAAMVVDQGASIVVAGSMVNSPMSLIRQLVRAGKKDLQLIVSPIGGINIDLLIGAKAAKSIEFPQISLGEFGLAPNFRRAAEKRTIQLKEHT
jgi:glutaconate CoA-transferase subunit A